MYETGFNGGTGILLLLLPFIVVMPLQILIFIKAKNIHVRLIPLYIFIAVLVMSMLYMGASNRIASDLRALFLAVHALLTVAACGIGIAAGYIFLKFKRK